MRNEKLKMRNEKGNANANVKTVKKIAFCTGKVYYDLIEAREKERNEEKSNLLIRKSLPYDSHILG